MKQPFIIFALLFILGSIWGSGPVINKIAISNGVTPLGYSFWQFIGPAILLTLIASVQGVLQLSKKHIPYYIVCGLIGIAIPNTILHFCAPHLPAGIMPIIINTVPIMIYPLAILAKQETFFLKRFIGILIGIIGIMILLLPNVSLTDKNMLPWAFLALISPLCFALTALFVNPYRPADTSSISLAAGMLLSAAIILTPILILRGDYYPISFPFNYADYAISFRICLSSLGYIILFVVLQKAGAVYYSLVSGIVILNGLFWGYMIYGETLNATSIFAITAILLAIIIMNSSHKKAEPA